MSQENVELTRRFTDALNRRDVEAVVALWDPEGVCYPTLETVTDTAEPYRGHAGVRQYFRDLAEVSAELTAEWSEVRYLGDQVLCLGRLSIAFSSGVTLDEENGGLLTWRNGKCIEVRGYRSHADALEAAGLRE